jgi:hypothetical protein
MQRKSSARASERRASVQRAFNVHAIEAWRAMAPASRRLVRESNARACTLFCKRTHSGCVTVTRDAMRAVADIRRGTSGAAPGNAGRSAAIARLNTGGRCECARPAVDDSQARRSASHGHGEAAPWLEQRSRSHCLLQSPIAAEGRRRQQQLHRVTTVKKALRVSCRKPSECRAGLNRRCCVRGEPSRCEVARLARIVVIPFIRRAEHEPIQALQSFIQATPRHNAEPRIKRSLTRLYTSLNDVSHNSHKAACPCTSKRCRGGRVEPEVLELPRVGGLRHAQRCARHTVSGRSSCASQTQRTGE